MGLVALWPVGPGLFPALAGGFLTTAPPGKSPIFYSFGYIPKSGIAGPYAPTPFYILSSNEGQRNMRVPISPHPHQPLLFSVFDSSHPSGCEVVKVYTF